MSRLAQYLPQIIKAITDYGYEGEILRHIYSVDEFECQILEEAFRSMGRVHVVIDNSGTGRQGSEGTQGFDTRLREVKIYAAFDEEFIVEVGDFIKYQEVLYEVTNITDLVHHNLLYQLDAKRVVADE